MSMRNELETILHKVETIMAGEDAMSQLEKDLIKSYLLKGVSLLGNTDESESAVLEESNHEVQRIEQEKEAMKAALASDEIETAPPAEENIAITAKEHQVAAVPEPVEILSTHTNGKAAVMPQDNTLVDMIQANPLDQRFSALFEKDAGSELSERLANTPITDLNKSIGINDRILYINELFGGDNKEYSETMDTLNRKHSFEDAQVFLSRHLIDKYDWMDDAKSDRAREFIRLIARRFKS